MSEKISYWSIYAEEYNGTHFPFSINKLVYRSWYDGNPVINSVNFDKQPTISEIKDACEELITKSQDYHHIYIEDFFEAEKGVFEMVTGS